MYVFKIKLVSIFFFFVFLFSSCVKNGENFSSSIAVMSGVSGFVAANLDDKYKLFVSPSPQYAIGAVSSKEVDFAILPVNTAAILYNKGVDIKVLSITALGMLSVLAHKESESTEIYTPGINSTPDFIAKYLFPELSRNYTITSPAQLSALFIAGKCDLAILPEPFVTYVLNNDDNSFVLSDVNDRWLLKTGIEEYPMSVLVAVKRANSELDNKKIDRLLKDFKNASDFVLKNPTIASSRAEEKDIMKKEMSENSVSKMNISFITGDKMADILNVYFDVILKNESSLIADRIPDENFIYKEKK